MRAFVVVLPFLILTGTAIAAGQQPVFYSKVDVVLVDVLVTSRGKPVTGLTANDFELRDNQVRQRIDSVMGGGTGVTPVPLDLVLVLDVSESMAGPNLELLADASRALLERLRPGDQAALVTFCERADLLHPLSGDLASVGRALGSITAGGRTSMFDGLYTGLMLRRGSTTRAAVLLFSDGRDNASWLDETAVHKAARESDVVVYGVGLDEEARSQLERIAQETGGALLQAESIKELKPAFLQLLGQMQARYVLAYSPHGVAREGWHQLDVRLAGSGGGREIRARRGYFVPAAKAPGPGR